MAENKKCVFKITSHVINLDESGKSSGDVEKDELEAAGFIKTEDGKALISYEERREGARVLCEILVDGESVRVKRRGDVICDMLFSPQKAFKGLYEAPPFSFDMEISTLKIENSIEKPFGSLSLFYVMNIGGAGKRCRMKITRKD